MMATYTDEEFVCKKDIYIVKLNDDTLSYKYILALLNSKLLSYYKTKNSGSAKEIYVLFRARKVRAANLGT